MHGFDPGTTQPCRNLSNVHCILTFCDLLAPALAGLRVAEEDVGGGAVVVVVTRAVETLGAILK